MESIYRNTRRKVARRTFLKGTGVAMALPWLDAMVPAFASPAETEPPRRFVSVSLGLGLHVDNLFPTEAGRNYKPSVYLSQMSDMLGDVTVCSGVSHPGVRGGHSAEAVILTAVPMEGGSSTFRNSISLDQLMAKHLGHETRYRSLVLGAASNGSSPSYTDGGAMITAEDSPSKVFSQLFLDDDPSMQEEHIRRLRQGQSIMDVVAADAKSLRRSLGKGDRRKLDEYFSSVRQLEGHLASSEEWIRKPKPKVDVEPPTDVSNRNDVVSCKRVMYGVMKLALQTDSTRFITFHLGGSGGVVPLQGVDEGYHSLSHHGKDDEKIHQLTIVESALVREWGDFLRELKKTEDIHGENLLDRTMVLLTSNLGNASAHRNDNMPVLFAGGGFKHGQHLAFDRDNNYPLPNLYVSALQRVGLPVEKFVTSTGTMRGLEMA